MGEEEAKQAAPETAPPPPEAVKDVAEEKAPIPPPTADEKPDESKALAVVESENFFSLCSLSLIFCSRGGILRVLAQ